MGSYVFRWPYPANDVHVTGTFDDWGKSEQLEKVGDIWEKEVQLPSADEKIYYKFVVDDQWIVDDHAPKEGDGHNNTNNVLLPENIKPRELTSNTPGAFPETPGVEQEFKVAPIPATSSPSNPIQLAPGEKVPDPTTITSNTIGSTVTTSKEDYDKIGQETEPTFSVNPLPGTHGTSNPLTLVPGEKVPDSKVVTDNTVDSMVTTSKEDYEKAGQEPDQEFSVNPIPASSGASNPITLAPGEKIPPISDFNSNKLDSSVTTSKEDYDRIGGEPEQTFSVQPIPPSSGMSNPITLTPGEKVPSTGDFNLNTIDSAVTTSKEDYDNAGTSGFPTAALGVAAAGAGIGGVATASALNMPAGKKNIIPESSLPADAPRTDTLDAGPFISSVTPGATTADLAAKVPLEQNRGTSPFISSATPSSTTAELAAKVPVERKLEESAFISSTAPGSTTANLAAEVPIRQPESSPFVSSAAPASTTAGLAADVAIQHQDVAAQPAEASREILEEKSAVEEELLNTVKQIDATGQPASAAAQQSSYYGLATSVPKPVETSMVAAGASPEAAADASVVAEKGAFEKELLATVSSRNEAGEPAPTIAAATSATAPTATSTDAIDLTDGQTANETIPGTDTSTTTRGLNAGAIAAGAAGAGAAAGIGFAAASARHADADVEPPRVDDAQKPGVSTGVAPATIEPEISSGIAGQPAAINTTLADEPAVRMMTQNEVGNTGKPTSAAVTNGSADAAALASGVPTVTSTGTAAAAESKVASQPTVIPPTSAPSTPAKQTTAQISAASSPASGVTSDAKRKRRHRLSAIIKDFFHKKE